MLWAARYNRVMHTSIECEGLRKRFGPALALDGMSFTVKPGQVTGFVGPNGAGKSTTMRVILGLDAPDEGTALVGGKRYASLRRPMRTVGSLLDAGAVQPRRWARAGRRQALRESAAAHAARRLASGRGGAPAEPFGPQPPALARPFSG